MGHSKASFRGLLALAVVLLASVALYSWAAEGTGWEVLASAIIIGCAVVAIFFDVTPLLLLAALVLLATFIYWVNARVYTVLDSANDSYTELKAIVQEDIDRAIAEGQAASIDWEGITSQIRQDINLDQAVNLAGVVYLASVGVIVSLFTFLAGVFCALRDRCKCCDRKPDVPSNQQIVV